MRWLLSPPRARPSRASAARRTNLRLRFAPAKSSGPCKGQNPRRGRAVNRSVGSLGSKVSQDPFANTRDRSNSEVGAIPPRFDHHDGRHLGHALRAPTLRGVARMHMTFDLSASSIASRIRSPVRGKVGAIAAAWNRVTRGVRESSSRGYVPLLLTVGGQPLDSLGFPAGVRASEAGVFGNAAHRSHSSWPPSKGFSRPSAGSFASRDASEQQREKTGRPTARSTGREDKRSITAVCDLVS
jgi:hypothetical protein